MSEFVLAYLHSWRIARLRTKVRRIQRSIAENLGALAAPRIWAPSPIERLAHSARILKLCRRDILTAWSR